MYLFIVALTVTVLGHVETAVTWLADTVSDHGFSIENRVIHAIGACAFCNAVEQFDNDLKAKVAADRAKNVPNAPQVPSTKPQIVVANPTKFVS